MSTKQGLLFVIVGPAGVGKNTLMKAALSREAHLKQLATVTTRARRPNEQDGREHHFVTLDRFQQMIDVDALLEWQEVHQGEFYGVPCGTVENALETGQHLIADLDVLGATYIRSIYPENVVLIFVKPPSLEALETRMRDRGETEADIQTRLTRVAMELAYLPLADYVVVNDNFDPAAGHFCTIISDEIARQCNQCSPQRTYIHTVTAIPLYGDEVLQRGTSPQYPTTLLLNREVPHLAALRVLEQTLHIIPSLDHLLRIKLNKGSFVSPLAVAVVQEGHTKHISFTYAYLLPERLHTDFEAHWRPLQALEYADSIQRALHSQQPTR